MRAVTIEPTFEAWQAAARALLREDVPPAEVAWSEAEPTAVAEPTPAPSVPARPRC